MPTTVIQDIRPTVMETWAVPGSYLHAVDLTHPKYEFPGSYIAGFQCEERSPGVFVITLYSTIVLPTWPAYKDAYTNQKAEWDRYTKALGKHEASHHTMTLGYYADLVKMVEKLNNPSLAEVTAITKSAAENADKKSKEYDDQTDHGGTEGAKLDQTIGSGSSSWGGCFASDTLVTLSDGSQKQIIDVCLRDELLFLDFQTMQVVAARPDRITRHDVQEIMDVHCDGQFCFTVSHDQDILTTSGPVTSRWLSDSASLARVDISKREVARTHSSVSRIDRKLGLLEVVSIGTSRPMGFLVGQDNLVGRCSNTDLGVPKR
jgi:Bacterial protein of unknown function (DUF922)